MQSVAPLHTDVVLLGGGHSHVEVLRQFAMNPPSGVRVTMVSRDVHTPYSGMLPGLIAGHYSLAESHIDLRRLARHCGARILQAAATGIDCDRQLIQFADRPALAYDILSIDIGSAPNLAAIDGAGHITPVKPVAVFWERWQRVIDVLTRGQAQTCRIVVIGGGAGGIELALSIDHKLATSLGEAAAGERYAISVVSGDQLLSGHSDAVRRILVGALQERGIQLIKQRRVTRVDERQVTLDNGEVIDCDLAIGVTNAAAATWLGGTGLGLSDDRFIRVNDYLQSVTHRNVFAAGDVARMDDWPLPRSGVYAVRQGPPLARNIRAMIGAEPLEKYRPQRHALAIISTGNAYAVASRGSWWLAGAWVWRWKDWIDRRWMERYQSLSPVMADADVIDDMRCGGCAAKVSAQTLEAALAGVCNDDASILFGVEARDDAAAIIPPPGKVLVQSVDQFRSFIDDPYYFALITTHHCVNDVLAMGARPHSALASVTLPFAENNKNANELTNVIDGIQAGLKASGAALVGGHTAEGAELSLGLTVNGFADESSLQRKQNIQIGDALILTKPLGTGVVIAADGRGAVSETQFASAIETMCLSNVAALSVLQQYPLHGLTDVTGFGLGGHLMEMLIGQSMTGRLSTAAIPVIDGITLLYDQGYRSSLHAGNESRYRVFMRGEDALHPLLYDPQTSGPLLAAVARAEAPACVAELHAQGYRDAAVIGMIEDAGDGPGGISIEPVDLLLEPV